MNPAVAIVLALAGAGAATVPAAAEPAAAEPPPVIEITTPDPMLVPPDELPAGLRIDEIAVPEGPAPVPAELLRDERGAQTLYRDATGDRQLVVARTESSDTGGAFAPVGAGEPVELPDGREATILEAGTLTIVGWDESDFDDCPQCSQTGVVASRGLERDEVLQAAAGAAVHEPAPTVRADALPGGLEVISAAPLLDQFEDLGAIPERILASDDADNQVYIFIFGGDDALAEHVGFWIEEGVHRGAAFGVPADVRIIEGSVVLTMAFGIDLDSVLDVVAGLRPGDATDVESAISDVQSASVTDADSCLDAETDPDRTAVLGGTTDDGARWVVASGLSADDGDIADCHELSVDGAWVTGAMSIGSPFDGSADPSVIDVEVEDSGGDDGRWWIVTGTVTAAAEDVLVTFAGAGEPVEAQISDVGPTDDWRWFAIAVPAPGEDRPTVEAVALDATGTEIAAGSTN